MFSMPTVIHCNPVLETHCAKGDKYIVFLSPVVAMVMMNRHDLGDPVWGQCSWCCVHCSQVLPQSCRGAVHWPLCHEQPCQSRYIATYEAVCVCVRARVCVCVCTGPAVIVLCTCVPALFTEHKQTRTCCVACIRFLMCRWIVTKTCCCLLVYYVAVGVHIRMYVCMYVCTYVNEIWFQDQLFKALGI